MREDVMCRSIFCKQFLYLNMFTAVCLVLGLGLIGCEAPPTTSGQEGKTRNVQILDANTRIITTQNGLKIKMTDLGQGFANSINNNGQIVGQTVDAILWEDGIIKELDGLFGEKLISRGHSINDQGQIVGIKGLGDVLRFPEFRGFMLENETITDLCRGFQPNMINENGQIVGSSIRFTRNTRATLWENGKWTSLGTLPVEDKDHWNSEAYAINDKGQIVGFSEKTRVILYHAFLWEDGKMIDLTPDQVRSSLAHSINNNGQIVGWSHIELINRTHAVLWQRDGSMIDLGHLGGDQSFAYSINEKGQVVGEGRTSSDFDEFHAFLWLDGEMIDLGVLDKSHHHSLAISINDKGQIVGRSGDHAVLWEIMD